MDIRTATMAAIKHDLWIKKIGREWCLLVAPGSVYRDNESYAQIDLDARDCMADDWYLVNAAGEVVNAV